MNIELNPKQYRHDVLASLVVFLVALPLCMGIAIASGLHPAAGLLTGIVGGIIIGPISGCPLQVSGPAAGLTVIIWEIVNKHGVQALGLIVSCAGLLQIAFGLLRFGQFFRAVSPAVVQGMLSGIGMLILASQFHVMLDDKPKGSGLDNLIAIPGALINCITLNHDFNHIAALIGLITIAVILIWEKLPIPAIRSTVPPTLAAVVIATALSSYLNLDVNRVSLPESLLAAVNLPDLNLIPKLNWTILQQGLVVAFIASAETLLTANAVSRMVPGVKGKYDQELLAQGIGNSICGGIGALPLTGVIVRSSVNIKAGARTRLSTILHGMWLLLFTVCFPSILRLIPTAVLAALLVYTGFKLLDVNSMRRTAEHGKLELGILAATMITIVATDLLTGVLAGIGLSVLKLLYVFCRLKIQREDGQGYVSLKLIGAATFLSLPKLAAHLDELPHNTELHVDFSELTYIDHACLDTLIKWEEHCANEGGSLNIYWGPQQAKFDGTRHLKDKIAAIATSSAPR